MWKRRAHLGGPREITRGKYFGRRSTSGEGENRKKRVAEGRARGDGAGAKIK